MVILGEACGKMMMRQGMEWRFSDKAMLPNGPWLHAAMLNSDLWWSGMIWWCVRPRRCFGCQASHRWAGKCFRFCAVVVWLQGILSGTFKLVALSFLSNLPGSKIFLSFHSPCSLLSAEAYCGLEMAQGWRCLRRSASRVRISPTWDFVMRKYIMYTMCVEYVIYIYEIHIWCTYMMYIYDIHIWCTYMMYIYDVHIWCTCMMCIYDIHIWCTYMMYIYDVHIWCTYTMCIYDIHIYDVHIWYTYMIYI